MSIKPKTKYLFIHKNIIIMNATHDVRRLQLVILRVGVAIAILCKIMVEFNDLEFLFTTRGIVPEVLINGLRSPFTLSLPAMVEFFHITNEPAFLKGLFLIYFCAAQLLFLGLFTRWSAAICFIIHLLLFNGYNLVTFGFDGFLFSLLFYNLIFPVGKVLSLDAYFFKFARKPINEQYLNLCIRLLQFHLCVVYLTAGIAKLKGHEWIAGTAVWSAINQPQFFTPFTGWIKSLASIPFIFLIWCWSTLIAEIGFPFFIWIKHYRIGQFALLSILLMHVFIGLAMGLQLFAWIMIVFDLAAFAGILPPAFSSKAIPQK